MQRTCTLLSWPADFSVPAVMLRLHTALLLVFVTAITASACAEHDAEKRSRPGHRIVNYHEARPVLWGTLYTQGGETLYCGQEFAARKGKEINIEHVFPMSWVAWHLKCGKRNECRHNSDEFNRIEADLHNLWPTLSKVNEARSSHPFGLIDGEKHLFRACDFELDERRRIVEPRPAARGEIARSMFYMANEYGLKIRRTQGRTLQRWNHADPVSAEERRRNDVIERIQGNRNPYIDNPELADALRF